MQKLCNRFSIFNKINTKICRIVNNTFFAKNKHIRVFQAETQPL